eukprot:3575604-Amphidinium_carterae.2
MGSVSQALFCRVEKGWQKHWLGILTPQVAIKSPPNSCALAENPIDMRTTCCVTCFLEDLALGPHNGEVQPEQEHTGWNFAFIFPGLSGKRQCINVKHCTVSRLGGVLGRTGNSARQSARILGQAGIQRQSTSVNCHGAATTRLKRIANTTPPHQSASLETFVCQ